MFGKWIPKDDSSIIHSRYLVTAFAGRWFSLRASAAPRARWAVRGAALWEAAAMKVEEEEECVIKFVGDCKSSPVALVKAMANEAGYWRVETMKHCYCAAVECGRRVERLNKIFCNLDTFFTLFSNDILFLFSLTVWHSLCF